MGDPQMLPAKDIATDSEKTTEVRNRSRSPRNMHVKQAAPQQTAVWAVTYHCTVASASADSTQLPQVRTIGVYSSKDLAKAAATKAMQARKVQMGTDRKIEDLAEKSLSPSEFLVCGFSVGSQDGAKEQQSGVCEWLLSSHVLDSE